MLLRFADLSVKGREILHGFLALALACGAGLAPGASQAQTQLVQPEAATGRQTKPGWQFRHEAVAAANPLAAEAGEQMLRAGGSAVDAAVAVQMVLTLVEPQSSGIGGGAFMVSWDGRKVEAWDGRETAPAAADPRQFLRADGRAMGMRDAIPAGFSVGTPGVLELLWQAHHEQGKLPWAKLFEPAIRLAEMGFAVSPRLAGLLQDDPSNLRADKQASAYFLDAKGQPWPVGHVLRNPALAAVLRQIAQRGPRAFYEGRMAADMVKRIRGAALPGVMTAADLRGYRAVKREVLCADWRSYHLCGMPPPSSGFIAVAQILSMLGTDPPPLSVAFLHRFTEASRLAFADRALYVGDPDFVPAPAGNWNSLLDAAYLRDRATLIGARAMPEPAAGLPRAATVAFAPQAEQVEHGTSHISIVDAQGHAIALTTSVATAFGSGLMSDGGTGLKGGFILNNQLTDFSFRPEGNDGKPVANRLEPHKRPRSSMTPVLVFEKTDDPDKPRLFMSLGAPGGSVIIPFVAKTLIGTLAWGMDAQRAIDLPNFGSIGGPVLLESDAFDEATISGLVSLGHRVQRLDLPSGTQAIERKDEGWFGAADPRREGVVRGD